MVKLNDPITIKASVISQSAADTLWEYLFEKTEDILPIIRELRALHIPPTKLEELLVHEVITQRPGRYTRLVTLLQDLKRAGLVRTVKAGTVG